MTRLSTVHSRFFYYKKNKQHFELYCEDIAVKDIIKKYGTPLYVVSQSDLEQQYNQLKNAFSSIKNLKIHYAIKANFNLSLIKTFLKLGVGVDVNSEGELFRALRAGAKPGSIIMAGVGKTNNEIEYAIRKEIKMIKIESVSELHRINSIAKKLKKKANIGIRVNPDVAAETHPYITTGKKEGKFGIEISIIVNEILPILKSMNNIDFIGLEMHLGSQIFDAHSYGKATKIMMDLVREIRAKGCNIRSIDLGGGFAITYDDKKIATPIEEYAKEILPHIQNETAEILFEPGRYLVGNSTILATEVLYLKSTTKGKKFIIVDAAMTELIRPSLYSAYHDILPIRMNEENKSEVVDVVGPVCETGDFLAKDRYLYPVKENEFLAVMSSGAYGSVMASNYNGRRIPAQVMIFKNKTTLISKRQSLEQLIQNEGI